MAITIEIPSALRLYSRGSAVITLDPDEWPCESVGDALSALEAQCPGVVDRVMTEQGDIRPHVNLFVDNENTRHTNGLATPLESSSTVTIIAAISGG